MKQRLVGRSLDETIGLSRESQIADAVDGEQWSHGNIIAYLRLLRIALCDYIVTDLPMEIAVIVKHSLRHLRTQFRIHPAHEYRLLAKRLGQPLGNLSVLAGEGIPYPKPIGERRAMIAAAEKRTVGSRCQCCLHLFLRRDEVLVGYGSRHAAVAALVVDLGKSNEELVAIGNVLCGRAGREQQSHKETRQQNLYLLNCAKRNHLSQQRHGRTYLIHSSASFLMITVSRRKVSRRMAGSSCVFSLRRLKMSLKCCSERRQMKPAPYFCV